jgi:hypothetical protein
MTFRLLKRKSPVKNNNWLDTYYYSKIENTVASSSLFDDYTTTINQITVNGQTITGNDNIANEFNNYFCEIGPKLAQTIPSSNVDPLQYITANSNKFAFRQI